MWTRLKVGVVIAVLAAPVWSETAPVPATCEDLKAVLAAATGLDLTAPPAASSDGWCVLDGARSSGDALRVSAETLRSRGEALGDRLVTLEVEGAGLRVAPALNNRDMPDWLRDLLRLQSAELRLTLRRDDAADLLRVERGSLALSGGGKLALTGEVAGAELAVSSLLTGRVTRLNVLWLNDGRTLRPVLEALGARLEPGAVGTEALLAARGALQVVVAALPAASVPEADAKALEAVIVALPQGRGRLTLELASDAGIGAAQLGLLALADDPASPEVLARFFKGTRVSVAWSPGLAP